MSKSFRSFQRNDKINEIVRILLNPLTTTTTTNFFTGFRFTNEVGVGPCYYIVTPKKIEKLQGGYWAQKVMTICRRS